MKIDIDNPAQLLSHVLLQDGDVTKAVAETDQFKDRGEITCTVQFNGVEVPAEKLEEVLAHFVKEVEKLVDLDSFNDKVEERAKQILSEHADNALEKIQWLTDMVDSPDMYIKPEWER